MNGVDYLVGKLVLVCSILDESLSCSRFEVEIIVDVLGLFPIVGGGIGDGDD